MGEEKKQGHQELSEPDAKQVMCSLIGPENGVCEKNYGHHGAHVYTSKDEKMKREIASVLNRYSVENTSNTPDFILAQYLFGCLAAWNTAVQQRETWYGRDARPSYGMLSAMRGGEKSQESCHGLPKQHNCSGCADCRGSNAR